MMIILKMYRKESGYIGFWFLVCLEWFFRFCEIFSENVEFLHCLTATRKKILTKILFFLIKNFIIAFMKPRNLFYLIVVLVIISNLLALFLWCFKYYAIGDILKHALGIA